MAAFIDKAQITVKAGSGGGGAVAFRREKYVAAGGPDGGDGGRGGSVVLRVDDNLSTLMDFRYKRSYSAPSGMNGEGGHRKGKSGEDLIIRVPRGTVVRDRETNEIIVDMSGQEDFVLAKGGRGGWGNSHFATPTRQVPRFAKASSWSSSFWPTSGWSASPMWASPPCCRSPPTRDPKLPTIILPPSIPIWGSSMSRRGSPSSWPTFPASLRGRRKGPDWGTTSYATSTAAA